MKNPLVSVCIPAYNHEKYVQETIQSIINQTYQNLELIILDDGSKDKTWQKIQEMEAVCKKRFTEVYFATKQNEGTSKTLNKLIDLAHGEFIYMFSSDDLVKPQAIEREVAFLSEHKDYGLCVGDDEIIDSQSRRAYWDKDRKLVYNKKEAVYKTFVEFLSEYHGFDFTSEKFGSYKLLYHDNHVPNGFLLRKSILDKIGGYNPKAPVEDWYLMMQISKYCKMKYINEILFSYRWHDSNSIKNSDKMRIMEEKTRQYEDYILDNISIASREVLPEVIEVKYQRDLSRLNNRIKDAEYKLYLIANKGKYMRKYIKYKILSKLTFGKKRKKYKEKRAFYKSELNQMKLVLRAKKE